MASRTETTNRLGHFALILGLALFLVPMVAMVWQPTWEQPLFGVVETAERPSLALKDVASEEFQKKLNAWFEQKYGLRPTLTRLDNTINYRLLHEMRGEASVRVGTDRILLYPEHVAFHNLPAMDREGVRKRAQLAADAQRLLEAHGKVIVHLFLPTKLVAYPHAVPPGWSAPIVPDGAPRPWSTTLYEPLMEELRERGVLFVDGARLLEKFQRERPDFLYTKEGRHLNAPAVCLVFDAALELARPKLPHRQIPKLDCTHDMSPGNWLVDEEYDFFRLLNVWGEPETKTIRRLRENLPETVPAEERAEALIMGSSFGGRVLLETRRNHTFRNTTFYYYNTTIETLDGDPVGRRRIPKPLSDEWRALTFGHDLYLLPTPQEYLPDGPTEFLEQVVRALSEE